ncbi:MAG: sulfite exporter TauE/SafE family protein [Spirosomataceae bacterium]
MILEAPELILFFFLIALVYASVGFGGGSSYLSLLSLYSFPFLYIKWVALLCNLVVVSNSSWQFIRRGLIQLSERWPLFVSSVLLAYLGAKVPLKERTFFLLLGSSLVLAALAIWFQPSEIKDKQTTRSTVWAQMLLGGAIGGLSGMVGIGGGIFLSPIMYLLKWDHPKGISATASVFILVNSVAGLIGQSQHLTFDLRWPLTIALLLAVALGGAIGHYWGAVKWSPNRVKQATSLFIFYIGFRLVWQHLFI